MERQKPSPIFKLAYLIWGLLFLNGCATSALWNKGSDVFFDKSKREKYEVGAETEQVYTFRADNPEENADFCIPFRITQNESTKNECHFPPIDGGYLLAKGPGKKNRCRYKQKEVLGALLKSDFKILSVRITRSFAMRSSEKPRRIGFHIVYEIPSMSDDEIVFVKDEMDIPSKPKTTFISNWPSNGLAGVVDKKWREKHRSRQYATLPVPLMRPVAWIDTNGNYFHETNKKEPSGLLLACYPNGYHIKYVKLMFDIPIFRLFCNSFSPGLANNDTLCYNLSSYDEKHVGFLRELDTSALEPLVAKSNSRKMKIIFHEPNYEIVYQWPAIVRIFGTPFTAAFDLVTMPVQAYILLLMCSGPG